MKKVLLLFVLSVILCLSATAVEVTDNYIRFDLRNGADSQFINAYSVSGEHGYGYSGLSVNGFCEITVKNQFPELYDIDLGLYTYFVAELDDVCNDPLYVQYNFYSDAETCFAHRNNLGDSASTFDGEYFAIDLVKLEKTFPDIDADEQIHDRFCLYLLAQDGNHDTIFYTVKSITAYKDENTFLFSPAPEMGDTVTTSPDTVPAEKAPLTADPFGIMATVTAISAASAIIIKKKR